jgi:hypothetical protein
VSVFSHAKDWDSDFEFYIDDDEFQALIDDIDLFVIFSDAMKGGPLFARGVYKRCLVLICRSEDQHNLLKGDHFSTPEILCK